VAVDELVQRALANDLVINITTTGRKTGAPRTLEIWFHRISGRYYITGWPGARGWYANLRKDPHLTVTFKQTTVASVEATARLVTGETERRRIIAAVFDLEVGVAHVDVESWVATSPVIEFVPVN
jgi:deazaflavin-dependent oxidoreductase (nitroreductase family)